MKKNLDFTYVTSGLEVSFRVLTKVPAKSIFDWDFGDDKGEVFNGGRHQSYSYEKSGFYDVTLHVTNSEGLDLTCTRTVVVCNYGHTTLQDTIYNLIDRYIPKELHESMTIEDKTAYITKWQLYIFPLVNHVIPPDKYDDELWYEGLENQLIMELAVWDYLNIQIQNILLVAGNSFREIISTESTGPDQDGDSPGEHARGDRIKQITTGPTEVQYYDKISESISSLWSTYSKMIQPGGYMDELRKNLCMLASRLEIYLPFCDQIERLVVPRVVNHRKPTPLGGPNPTAPLNKVSKPSLTIIDKKS